MNYSESISYLEYYLPNQKTKMKNSISPLKIAIDSVAFLITTMAWAFIVWVPVLAAFVFFFKAKGQPNGALIGLGSIASIFILIGLFLKWLGKGIVMRTPLRLIVSALSLFILGVLTEQTSRSATSNPLQRINNGIMGPLFILAAIILLFGLLKSERLHDE